MDQRPAWAERLRDVRLRKTPRWSQARAVTALEQKAREFHLAVPGRESLLRMLKGWERGDHEPNDFYRSLWALVYDVPERVLFAELPPSALSVLGLGLVAVEADFSPADTSESVGRRAVLLGGTLLGSLALVGPPSGYRVGASEVREVTTAARTMQRWDRLYGGWVPYQAAVGNVDSAMRLVRGTYTERVASRLLPAVADLCAVTGWIAYDVGRHQEALRYFALGVQVAQQGQDAAIAARLLCDMARVNADLGNPMQSIELLGLASHLSAREVTPMVRAKLHTMEAKTYAILGRRESCHLALGKAEHQITAACPTDREPDWIRYFDEAQFAGVVGSCYRDLAGSDPKLAVKAEAPIALAMKQRGEEHLRNWALDRVNLATARLRRRELDGMCEEGNVAVDLALTLRSHRVTSRLRGLARQSQRFARTHAGVAALGDRIAELPALS